MVNPRYRAGENRTFVVPYDKMQDFVNKISNGSDKANIGSVSTSSDGKVTVTYKNDGLQTVFPAYSNEEASRITQELNACPDKDKILSVSTDSDHTVKVMWR